MAEDCEECEEECEECGGHQQEPQMQDKKVQPQTMKTLLKKFGKKVKIGKDFHKKGKASKELSEFLDFSRLSVDKTFVTARPDLSQASVGMEKAFELLLKQAKEKHIEPESFTLGIIFGLSRWAFLEGELTKKEATKILKQYLS